MRTRSLRDIVTGAHLIVLGALLVGAITATTVTVPGMRQDLARAAATTSANSEVGTAAAQAASPDPAVAAAAAAAAKKLPSEMNPAMTLTQAASAASSGGAKIVATATDATRIVVVDGQPLTAVTVHLTLNASLAQLSAAVAAVSASPRLLSVDRVSTTEATSTMDVTGYAAADTP